MHGKRDTVKLNGHNLKLDYVPINFTRNLIANNLSDFFIYSPFSD